MLQPLHRLGGYREFQPPREVDTFVESPWIYSRPDDSTGHHVLPDAAVSVALNCRRRADGAILDAELVYIGPVARVRFYHPPPGVHLEAVRVNPEWSRDLLGIDPAEHFDASRPLKELARDGWPRLLDTLAKTTSSADAVRILVDRVACLGERLQSRENSRVHRALEALRRDEQSRLDLPSLARRAGISVRHLRRLIQRTTGIAPKQFQRIRRLNRAVAIADTQAKPHWATLATETGYYDQAHMIDEFRALTGFSPAILHAERRAET